MGGFVMKRKEFLKKAFIIILAVVMILGIIIPVSLSAIMSK